MRWIYRGEYTSIYFIILYNTPVGVVRKRKILTFVCNPLSSDLILHIVKVLLASPLSKMWKFS